MFISRQRSARRKMLRHLTHPRPCTAGGSARCHAEALERRLLLARMGPEPYYYHPATDPHHPALHPALHVDEYYVPPARVAPGANVKFTGQFVVTVADGVASAAAAKRHGASHAHAFRTPANANLWHFEKGANPRKLHAALKKDRSIRDAYPVYADPAPAPAPTAIGQSIMSDVLEAEPNNDAASATAIAVSSAPNLIGGAISSSTDVDFYSFTLPQRSGVYLDIDAFENGLSQSLDAVLTLFNSDGAAQLATNDDGRDFDGFTLNEDGATGLNVDSALYADLPAGTYTVRVSAFAFSTGSYQLAAWSDSTYAATVPVFESNPGAADTLFLDFDGHDASDAWGTYSVSPYDFSGDALEWSPGERRAIENLWRLVADAFAPFNINVTTRYGGAYEPDATAFRQVITNSSPTLFGQDSRTLGIALPDSYANHGPGQKTAFTFAANFNYAVDRAGVSGDIMTRPIEMGNTTAHEFGHALGLRHFGGTHGQFRTFMHSPDIGLNRERWGAGPTSDAVGEPPVALQDDLAIISNLVNTFGYRADDHGDTLPAATPLAPLGNTYTAVGVIAQTADADLFAFSGSGTTVITLEIPEHLHHLDGELHLYDAAGTLLASASAADRLAASLNFPLPEAGNYYVEVRSDGGTGEIGRYTVRVDTTVSGGGSGSIAGRVFRDAAFDNAFESGAGDTPLAGVTVYLDADNDGHLDDGETRTFSSADGAYLFPGLIDGAYRIRQLVPDGYSCNIVHSVSLVGGAAMVDRHFGNWPIDYAGSAFNDEWTVRLKPSDPTRLQVVERLNGGSMLTYEAPHAIAAAMTFRGGAGNDRVTVESAPSLLPVDFEGGNDDDALVLAPAAGATVVFNGGTDSGFDAATYAGTAGDDLLTITDFQVSGAAGNLLSYAQVERLTVNADGGADAIAVESNDVSAELILSAGAGDDTITLGGGDLDDLPGPVTLHGGDGADQLILDDRAIDYPDQIDVDAVTVTREFFGGLTYLTMEGLTIHGGSGANDFIIHTTAADTPVTVNGGAGSDTLVQNGAAAPVTFNGGLDAGFEDLLQVNGGTYIFNANATAGSAKLWVNVESGAEALFNASQTLAGLTLDGGTATLAADGSRLIDTAALAIAAGKLDLQDNAIIVRAAALGTWVGSAYTDVSGLVDSARGSGDWTGDGIGSSMASANPSRTLGVAAAGQIFNIDDAATATWQGATVRGEDVLIRFTWGGDANIDGKINIDDYGIIDSSIGQSGALFGWRFGDFNYDGKINIDDYGIIDSNLSVQNQTL